MTTHQTENASQKEIDFNVRIAALKKSKNYEALASLADLRVYQGHFGYGWRGRDMQSLSDDFPRASDAWEAACFESGLMDDPETLDTSHSHLLITLVEELG